MKPSKVGSFLVLGNALHRLHETAIVTQAVLSGRISLAAFRALRFSYDYLRSEPVFQHD